MWPDSRYVASDESYVNTSSNFAIVIAGCALRSVVFGFAREVATAKGPSDLVQTWTTHATKQFDVLTKQASELTILGQRFANTTADSVTRAGKGSKPE